MRLYTFVNFYLSSIQQGIQSAHLVHELFNKYSISPFAHGIPQGSIMLNEWSRNHKTMIVLNGGINETLNDLYEFMKNDANPFPFTRFNEDEQSLGGIMTCVGIVLSEKIYGAAEEIRSRKSKMIQYRDGYRLSNIETGWYNQAIAYTQFEVDLIERMNQCPLAR